MSAGPRHVSFVSFVGLRVREQELLALGITLPGLGNRKGAVAQLPALGLLTLAGMMPAGWACSYYEADDWTETLAERITAEQPVFVAVSALTAGILEAYAFCSELRRRGVPTVIGGLHATACPEEAVRYATAIVAGDGETVWRQLLADAESGCLAGIYRSPSPFDLRQSPMPRFDLAAQPARSRYTIQSQRGCPFACEFCAASRLLGGFREKPAELVRNEVNLLKTFVPSAVLELADDNTFAGTRDASELLQVLSDGGLRYFTESDWRIGEKPTILKDLAASGCVQVLIGIETLQPLYRGFGKKRADIQRVMNAVHAIQEHGVAVAACFVIGGDGDTLSSLADLTEFLLESQFADVQVTLQTPFPGSPLRHRLSHSGRLLADRSWNHYTLFDVTFVPDQLTVAELEHGYRELARVVYSSSENNRRLGIRRKIWSSGPLAHRERLNGGEKCA